MRTRSLLLVLGILALFGATEALAATITGPFVPGSGSWTPVSNGGFETDLAQWSDTNCNSHLGTFSTAHTGPVALGSKSAQSSPSSDGAGAGFCRWQGPLTLDTSTTYVLSGFFHTGELDAPQIYAELVSGDLSYEAAVAGGSELAWGEGEWQFAWVQFQPTQSTLYLRIVHDENYDSGKHGYFDEMAITEVGAFAAPIPIPEPTTSLLLATGLTGLAAARRRRPLR